MSIYRFLFSGLLKFYLLTAGTLLFAQSEPGQ